MIRAINLPFFSVFSTDGYSRRLKQRGHKREGAFLAAGARHDRGEHSDRQFFQTIGYALGEPVEAVERELNRKLRWISRRLRPE